MVRELIRNPMLNSEHQLSRAQLILNLPQLASSKDDSYLHLAKYYQLRPWTFHCRRTFTSFSTLLESIDSQERKAFVVYIREHCEELNRALQHLDEINHYGWHDSLAPKDEMQTVRFLDQTGHPAYLRLSEAIWTPLLRIAAHFSRMKRAKSTDGLDAFNVYEELRSGPLACATDPFQSVVRNGISHGGTQFRDDDIWYSDKRGNQLSLAGHEMIRMCDDMLDVCNGLSFALAVFLVSRRSFGYLLPNQLLFEELRAQTTSSWWRVDACIPAIRSDHSQLTIYVQANTWDKAKAEFSAFQTGILAGLLAPGFDRYFLSIQSRQALIPLAVFKGEEIARLALMPKASYLDCAKAISDNMFGYDPKVWLPKWVHQISTFFASSRIHWPRFKTEMRRQFRWPQTNVRLVSIHQNGWRSVLRGQVFVIHDDSRTVSQDDIVRLRGRIVRRALRIAKKTQWWFSPLRVLPLGFARISVFKKDYRQRRLVSFGLSSDLICTIQLKRIERIRAPDIFGSKVKVIGKYRIAWNQAWLEETGISP